MKKISIIFACLAMLFAWTNRAQAQCTNGTDCYIVVTCTDSYPYGYSSTWNYSSVTVSQDGVLLATCNNPNAPDTVRICTANGPLSFSYYYSYPSYLYYKQFAGFTITDSIGNVICDVPTARDMEDGVFLEESACPTCNKPYNVTPTNITSTSATINWGVLGNVPVGGWLYSYGTSSTPSGTWQLADDSTVVLSGLMPNTEYHFFVYANCGSGDTSAVSRIVFRTACGPITLPYTESFESYDVDELMPYCWSRFETAVGYGTTYPYVNDYYSHTGNNSFYFYPQYGNQSVISPKIPVAANTLEVKVWVNGAEAIEVGYVTSLDTSVAVFHQVGIVGPTTYDYDSYSYAWEEFTVPFDTVTTTDSIYVVFRASASIEYNTTYIDDIVFRTINNCPLPTDVTASSSVSQQITVNWTCPTGSQWQVAYGPQGFDPDTATTFVSASTTSATITGLDNSTVYDFYVRTVCGTQTSYWSLPATMAPYLYTVTAAVDTIITCDRIIVDNGGINGNFSTYTEQTIVLLPSEVGQTVRIRGMVDFNNGYAYSGDDNLMRIFDGTDTTGMLLGHYYNVYNNNIDLTAETGAITIWFRGADYVSNVDEGFQFYVSCEDAPECTTPYGLTVSNIAGSSATVSWQYNTALGEANGFSLMVTDNTTETTTTYNLGGTDRSYILTGLEQRTFYTVQLALDCEGIDTIETTFATVCNNGGEVQIGDGSATTSYMPTYIYYGNTISQQIFTAAELDGVTTIYGVQFNMTGSGTTTRQVEIYMDTTSISSYSSSSDYVVATNRYFNGTMHVENGWITFDFDSAFTVPAGKNVVLTFNDKTNSYSSSYPFACSSTSNSMAIYAYRDGTSFDPTSSDPFGSVWSTTLANTRNNVVFMTPCSESSCVPPIMGEVVVGQTTVELNWLAGGTETSWRVDYRHADSTNWITAAANLTTTSYTITGLASANEYRIRIYAICGVDDESFAQVNISTLCGPVPVPFKEGFENFTASTDPNEPIQQCWNRGSNYPYSYGYPYVDSWNPGFNSNQCANYGGYRSYFVLPEMAVSIDSLNITFFASTLGSNYYGDPTVEVGVCTNPYDTSTFVVLGSQTIDCNSYDWQEVDVDLENYTGTGRIFIRSGDDSYMNIYIDSIVVNYLPTCRRVNGVDVTITPTTAVLNITDNHNYGSYDIRYSTVDDITTGTTITATSTTVTLDSLDENTQYYVWVRSNCSPSHYSKAYKLVFRTTCSTFVITDDNHYTQEFESGILDCMWQPATNSVMWSNEISNYDVHAYSGGHMAAITGMNASEEGMLVLPDFDFSQLTDNAELIFYRYLYATTYNNPALAKLAVYYRVGNTGDWTLLTVCDSTKNTWQRKKYTLPASQGASLYQVALKGYNFNSYTGLYVEDITVRPTPSCHTPENVEVRNIGERVATVAWTGNAPAYKVQYRPAGILSWNARTVEGVDTINISPLEMATLYEVRVTGLCSAYDRSDPSDPITFNTEFCDDRNENNNYAASATAGVIANAIFDVTKYYSYAEILVDSATLAGMTTINGLAFDVNSVGGGAYVNDCEVYMAHTSATSMSAFLYDNSFVQVYHGNAGFTNTGARRLLFNEAFDWDGHSNVVVGFRYSSSNYNSYDTIKYNAHQASANKVYYGSSNTSFSLDQANMISAANRHASSMVPDLLLIGCNPVCYAPVISRVNTTADNITVEWYNEGGTVQLQLKLSSETNWDSPVMVDEENSYTFENLPGMTGFDIRLRRDCTVESLDFSDWVYASAYTDTACSIPDGVIVTNVTGTTATFSWTDGPMVNNAWQIHVWNTNVNYYYEVTSNPATIDGLVPGSSYRAAVRAYCGSNDHVLGEYSDELMFDNVCQPVTGLTASVNGTSVVLNWTPGARNTQWLVSYGYYGFEPNDQLGYMVVNTTSATIPDLGVYTAPYADKGVDNNQFTFRVRAICAEGWNSDWSSDVSATLVGIDEVEGANTQVVLQPNPATDRVSLHMSDFEGEAAISILSVDGREMYNFDTHNTTFDFDVSTMAAGTYFVRVQTAEWTAVRKLIVK